jgi:phospholipid transport system substrate-binding protein
MTTTRGWVALALRAISEASMMMLVAALMTTTGLADLILTAPAFAAPATAGNDPAAGVRSMVDRALSVVRNEEMSLAAKRGAFKDLIARHFDLAGIARDSLGEHWPQLDAAAQSKFSQAFNDLVSDTYLGEIRDFDRATLQDVSQELRGANAEVSGTMRGGGASDKVADLKIKLRDIAGQWKIHDYSFNNGSTMRNYSADFKQAFENGGFDGLMDRVKAVHAKVSAELAQGRDAAGAPKSVE